MHDIKDKTRNESKRPRDTRPFALPDSADALAVGTEVTMKALAVALLIGSLSIAALDDGKPSSPAASTSAPASLPAHATVGAGGLKRLVASYRGKVILLDFWATWCAPCVEGLPELGKLQKRFGGKEFAAIAVSFDEPSIRKQVDRTLRRARWNGPSVIVKDRAAQLEIVKWLGSDWRSELPARYIINRNGKVVREVLEKNSDSLPSIEKMVEEAVFGASDRLDP